MMTALDRFNGPIEVAPYFRPRPSLRHAMLDWDGTISLLRGGWVEVMTDLCLEHLPAHPDETAEQLQTAVHAEMLALNGKPSIHQMARIAELVMARAGSALHADDYQRFYVARITTLVEQRNAAVLSGSRSKESLMVPGARRLLETMHSAGLHLTLVSGTPHPELVEEAKLLDVQRYFGNDIYGPQDTGDRIFTKRASIHELIAKHQIPGDKLVAIGDGPVEIAETKAIGGLAIAVASDENTPGSRQFDEFKRKQLLDCGADLVVPDFQDAVALLQLARGL
jgi:phosphoglycolate phosphatase-like HAD superfamily hydrolase